MPRPLSFAQERMWLFNQLEPDSPLYTGVRATRWTGRLDRGALERALTEIVRRHEVLRTCYPMCEHGAVQAVMPASPVALRVLECAAGPPAEVEAEIARHLRAAPRTPFDLTREAPLRALLLRLGPTEHVLALAIHHVAFDRWSRGVLFDELVRLYAAFAAGNASPLPEPALQYGEYAERQRSRFGAGRAQDDLAYWTTQLAGAPPLLDLGSGPRPARQNHIGERVSRVLPADVVAGVAAMSRRARATPFMTLLSVFAASLSRATGGTDLVIGSPVAGRMAPELEGLIGCFTNTLVLRLDLSGDPTFAALLRRTRAAALGAYAHAELPFERLVEALRPPRVPGRHPVFQVLFNFLDFPVLSAALPDLRVEDMEADAGPALVDLSVDLRRAGAGYRCDYSYDTALFDRNVVEGLADCYVAILHEVLEDDGVRLSSLRAPGRARSGVTESLIRELDGMSDAEAERLLAAELREGV